MYQPTSALGSNPIYLGWCHFCICWSLLKLAMVSLEQLVMLIDTGSLIGYFRVFK